MMKRLSSSSGTGMLCVAAFLLLLSSPCGSFLVAARPLVTTTSASRLPATTTEQTTETTASFYQAEAGRMRLEAERMDKELTLKKIQVLEETLDKLRKQPDADMKDLEEQLNRLQQKIMEKKNGASNGEVTGEEESSAAVAAEVTSETRKATSTSTSKEKSELSGFDAEDLELYVPVALAIQKKMASQNSTLEDMLIAFREAPELQEHFSQKLRTMLVAPMQDLQRLEELKSEYLYSTSSLEKQQLKREIQQLERTIEEAEEAEDGPFSYSDSIYRSGLDPLTDELLRNQLEALQALPVLLQALFVKRCGLDVAVPALEDDTLQLAIQLDHYEEQLQLLEQVKFFAPLTDEMRNDTVQALDSLPPAVRQHLASTLNLPEEDVEETGNATNGAAAEGVSTEQLLKGLTEGAEDPQWSSLKMVVEAMSAQDGLVPEEYNDIDFVDRSRYVEELYPAIARLEGQHPTLEQVTEFSGSIRSAFRLTSKPERVIGGYYLRGENVLSGSDDEDEGSRSRKLVARLSENVASKNNGPPLDFYYMNDPSPLSDEQIELGYTKQQPVLLATAKLDNKTTATLFYDYSTVFTKTLVSGLGLFSMAIVSLGTCELQQQQHSLESLVEPATQIFLASMGIQLAHEMGHRLIAWRDKFSVGLPTFVPSIQLGLFGSISPLTSPPPTLKSLFDFAMAGPVLGIVASLLCLVGGLDRTASADVASLPALPVFALRSSSLGGGLVEYFLGGGLLSSLPEQQDVVIPLDPLAIAGFLGVMTNALALLPLGNTDGGRIAIAMFGRRGTYLVKTFTGALLCIAGLFGLDESRILLTYVLYTVIWQRELETPARNEVEELDFGRGALAIASAVFVALVLVPVL